MLGAETAVPVDLGVVEMKSAVFLVDFHIQVWVAGEELVAKSAVFVPLADFVCFVDHGADGGVFVEEDGGDEVFVREVLLAEVEVGLEMVSRSVCWRFWVLVKSGKYGRTDVADDAESRGEFVLLGFWEYGTHYVIWLS